MAIAVPILPGCGDRHGVPISRYPRDAPSAKAVMPRMPLPQPRSTTRASFTTPWWHSSASMQRRVLGCSPVPKARPGSMHRGRRWACPGGQSSQWGSTSKVLPTGSGRQWCFQLLDHASRHCTVGEKRGGGAWQTAASVVKGAANARICSSATPLAINPGQYRDNGNAAGPTHCGGVVNPQLLQSPQQGVFHHRAAGPCQPP